MDEDIEPAQLFIENDPIFVNHDLIKKYMEKKPIQKAAERSIIDINVVVTDIYI